MDMKKHTITISFLLFLSHVAISVDHVQSKMQLTCMEIVALWMEEQNKQQHVVHPGHISDWYNQCRAIREKLNSDGLLYPKQLLSKHQSFVCKKFGLFC